MATLGEKLKREREARGVSLQEISSTTRINMKFLVGLEKDDYSEFPAEVFISGFLRSYASHLGLDVDKILNEYDATREKRPKQEYPIKTFEEKDKRLPVTTTIVVLVAVLVIYIGYKNWASYNLKTEADKIASVAKAEKLADEKTIQAEAEKEIVETKGEGMPGESAEDTGEEPVTEEEGEKETAPAVTKAVKPQEEEQSRPVPKAVVMIEVPEKSVPLVPPPKYRLRVTAVDKDAWILVVIDDENVRDMFVRAGQTIIMKGNKSFVFTTGNASQIRLTVNGRPLSVKVPRSNVIRNWKIPLH